MMIYFIIERLSRRSKRLICLASVLGQLGIQHMQESTITVKLNRMLKLAHDDDAVKFPMYVHSWIWVFGKEAPEVKMGREMVSLPAIDLPSLTNREIRYLADFFYTHAPSCLIYSSRAVMLKDLERLIRNTKSLLGHFAA
jgi:hypothetical protein